MEAIYHLNFTHYPHITSWMGLKSIFNNILHITNSCFITNILLQVKKMYNWQKHLLEK